MGRLYIERVLYCRVAVAKKLMADYRVRYLCTLPTPHVSFLVDHSLAVMYAFRLSVILHTYVRTEMITSQKSDGTKLDHLWLLLSSMYVPTQNAGPAVSPVILGAPREQEHESVSGDFRTHSKLCTFKELIHTQWAVSVLSFPVK